jgi:hypothetical protein
VKKILPLFALLAALASASPAQAPCPFEHWLDRVTLTAAMFEAMFRPSQDAMYWYFAGRLSALEDVRDQLP